uniref:uncharacterized protein LOC122601942 n=1 Tax=Erigeron canadensis TaxID=72917 RepID=UPI001CB8D9CA|nr:uncharacterized protein LOC122601942 [Erigeron canadensis]
MKLIWSPEMAAKAFTDTVKSCELHQGSSVSELISAMAAGWNAKNIIETWCRGGIIATSIGLAVASTHTSGRHVCIVPDQDSKTEYITAMKKAGMSSTEVIIGEAETVIKGSLDVIDFLVVDSRQKDFVKILKAAKFGHRGAVLVCKNASTLKAGLDFQWASLFEEGGGSRRIVRSVYLPVGNGLDIGHVSAGGGELGLGLEKVKKKGNKWIKRIDRQSGEEFLIRK